MIKTPILLLFSCGMGFVLQKQLGFCLDILSEIQKIACVDKGHKSECDIRKLPKHTRFAYSTEESYNGKENKIYFLDDSVLCKIGERRFAVIRPTDECGKNKKENTKWQNDVGNTTEQRLKCCQNESVAIERGGVLLCEQQNKPRCGTQDNGIKKHFHNTEESLLHSAVGIGRSVCDGGCAASCFVGDKSFGKTNFHGMKNECATDAAADSAQGKRL